MKARDLALLAHSKRVVLYTHMQQRSGITTCSHFAPLSPVDGDRQILDDLTLDSHPVLRLHPVLCGGS